MDFGRDKWVVPKGGFGTKVFPAGGTKRDKAGQMAGGEIVQRKCLIILVLVNYAGQNGTGWDNAILENRDKWDNI